MRDLEKNLGFYRKDYLMSSSCQIIKESSPEIYNSLCFLGRKITVTKPNGLEVQLCGAKIHRERKEQNNKI